MTDIKWIKITTDMFDNRKIKHLRRLPDGNSIVLIWVMLLTMAGRCNSGGMIFLTENIPYTPKMLADELDFEENTVRLAIEALSQLGMIVTDNSSLRIANWEKHQNIEGMERIREQNRLRKQRQRDRKLLEENTNRDCHVTVTECHATDIDIEEDKEKEEYIIIPSNEGICKTDVLQVIEKWNSLGLSQITKLSPNTNRSKLLKARIKEYGLEKVLEAIDGIKNSDFLMGKNKDGWTITFDWLIKPNNFPKVLDGNYTNNGNAGGTRKEVVPSWAQRDDLEDFMRQMSNKTAGNTPEIAARAKELKERLAAK